MTTALSLDQLKRAVQIHEQIESLQAELASILGGAGEVKAGGARRGRKPGKKAGATEDGNETVNKKATGKKKGKRVMSPEAREKIAAAQRKRWAKTKRAAKKAAAPTE